MYLDKMDIEIAKSPKLTQIFPQFFVIGGKIIKLS